MSQQEQRVTHAHIEFEDGDVINVNLYPDIAPLSVSNFIFLAKSGYYNGLCFHRVIKNFMIQGGGFTHTPNGLISAKAANKIRGEFDENGIPNPLRHKKGVLSMARTNEKNSATSQFFICVADCRSLDGKYAAFGECSDKESLKKAINISKISTDRFYGFDDVPVQPVVIRRITVDTAQL